MAETMERIRVSHIQRFSVNDGEGIRTTVFLAGCLLRCAWCCNPETWEADPAPASYPAGASKILGRAMAVDEIVREIRRDNVFHRASGGGVTWSGGEPFFSPPAISALVEACAAIGLRQAAETSGLFSWVACETTVKLLDFVFLDIKHMDSDVHERLTGVGNGTILENAERLGALGVETVVRVPLVKGANDGAENLALTARFVRRVMRCNRMEILPYHDLGREKYELLGLDWRRAAYERPSREDVERAERIVASEGAEIVRYR